VPGVALAIFLIVSAEFLELLYLRRNGRVRAPALFAEAPPAR